MVPLVAAGVCVRMFQRHDIPAFVAAASESAATVGPWLPWCHAGYSIAEAETWFESCERNFQWGLAHEFGIFAAEGGELLGGVGINQLNREHNFGNVGYWVRETRQRCGIASKAVGIVAQYGFREIKLSRLEIVIAETNQASRRLAEKIGATFECVARNRLVIRGQPCAAAVYSLVPGQPGMLKT